MLPVAPAIGENVRSRGDFGVAPDVSPNYWGQRPDQAAIWAVSGRFPHESVGSTSTAGRFRPSPSTLTPNIGENVTSSHQKGPPVDVDPTANTPSPLNARPLKTSQPEAELPSACPSEPHNAAPIAPAPGPSAAATTSGCGATQARRATSSRIGPRSSSPAAATPPPIPPSCASPPPCWAPAAPRPPIA